MMRAAILLAALMQYARHPATPNSPRWVSIIVPEDFIEQVNSALGEALSS